MCLDEKWGYILHTGYTQQQKSGSPEEPALQSRKSQNQPAPLIGNRKGAVCRVLGRTSLHWQRKSKNWPPPTYHCGQKTLQTQTSPIDMQCPSRGHQIHAAIYTPKGRGGCITRHVRIQTQRDVFPVVSSKMAANPEVRSKYKHKHTNTFLYYAIVICVDFSLIWAYVLGHFLYMCMYCFLYTLINVCFY